MRPQCDRDLTGWNPGERNLEVSGRFLYLALRRREHLPFRPLEKGVQVQVEDNLPSIVKCWTSTPITQMHDLTAYLVTLK